MIKLVFLVRSLNVGGAERQVTTLARSLDPKRFEVTIFQFYAGGALKDDLSGSSVRVVSLDKGGRWDLLIFAGRLLRKLRRARPDILHSYIDIPNVLAILLKPFFPRMRIVWGIRSAYIDLDCYGWSWRVPFILQCRLATHADLIIANSQAARTNHVDCGFPEETTIVIPNGIDTTRFKPDAQARARLRAEWQIEDDTLVIGLAGRLDPMKDHPTFLHAAVLLRDAMRASGRKVRFVCSGEGPAEYTRQMHLLCDELGLGSDVIWLGVRQDMPDVYNAMDIATNSSSFGESLSNAVGEAMACGVPCVVTQIGDSAWVVGDTGLVVPPRDPKALAAAWQALAAHDRTLSGAQARSHILENLSVELLVGRTEKALLQLVNPLKESGIS